MFRLRFSSYWRRSVFVKEAIMVSILFISTVNCRRKEFQFELEASLIVLGRRLGRRAVTVPCVYGIRWDTMLRFVGTYVDRSERGSVRVRMWMS